MSVIILSWHFHSEQLLSNQLLQSLCAVHFSLCVFHVMPFSPFFFYIYFFTVVFLHLHSGSSNNVEIFRKQLYKNNSEKRKSHTHICLCACTYTLFLWVGFDFGNHCELPFAHVEKDLVQEPPLGSFCAHSNFLKDPVLRRLVVL